MRGILGKNREIIATKSEEKMIIEFPHKEVDVDIRQMAIDMFSYSATIISLSASRGRRALELTRVTAINKI